jgi:hypothetical protein
MASLRDAGTVGRLRYPALKGRATIRASLRDAQAVRQILAASRSDAVRVGRPFKAGKGYHEIPWRRVATP